MKATIYADEGYEVVSEEFNDASSSKGRKVVFYHTQSDQSASPVLGINYFKKHFYNKGLI